MQQAQKTPIHYEGREQSLVKHKVLEQYLLEFGLKVGSKWPSITYVDGFSGPWNVKSEKLEDASFAIALRELRKARAKLAERQIDLRLRCFFVEADPGAFAKLKAFKESVEADGVAEIEIRNCPFEDAIDDIRAFVKKDPQTFPFVFIDPTGWTGFSMNVIRKLLQLQPVEVLVNFMTRHIKRFIDAPEQQRHDEFEALFGSNEYRKIAAIQDSQDREDALVRLYMQNLKATGNFKHVCAAIVLHPEIEATHFHLIYATRKDPGVNVFKTAERKAMDVQEDVRGEAQQRQRSAVSDQLDLLSARDLRKGTQVKKLRERYRESARSRIWELLEARGSLDYDTAWFVAAARPLVCEGDVKDWIEEWANQGLLKVEGLKPRARRPQCGEGHRLVRIVKA